MNLHGYDISFDLGRSAVNKILVAIQSLPEWNEHTTFEGRSRSNHPDTGLIVESHYKLTLSNLRMRPRDEQSQALGAEPFASVGLWIDVKGQASVYVTHADRTPDAPPILSYNASLDGEMAATAHALVRMADGKAQLLLSFKDAGIERMTLHNLPPEIEPILSRMVAYIAASELPKQREIPLTGLVKMSGKIQGLVVVNSLLLKTHFYVAEAGDLAINVAVVFQPGESSKDLRKPGLIRRGGVEDVSLSASFDYANRLISNIIASMPENRWHFGGSRDRREDKNWLTVRSIVVAADEEAANTLRVHVRLGHGKAAIKGSARIYASVAGDHLKLLANDVRIDLAGAEGILVKIITNIIYLLLREIGGSFAKKVGQKQLDVGANLASGIAIDRAIFNMLPANFHIRTDIVQLRVDERALAMDFKVTATT